MSKILDPTLSKIETSNHYWCIPPKTNKNNNQQKTTAPANTKKPQTTKTQINYQCHNQLIIQTTRKNFSHHND